MRTRIAHINDQTGSVTIIATLLILVVVTIITMTAMNNTTVELTVASNDQLQKIAFYNADSGIYGTPKLVSRIINTSEEVPVGAASATSIGLQYDTQGRTEAQAQTDFFNQVMGYNQASLAALTMQPTINTNIGVRRVRQRVLAGGGAEFAAGTEGVGVGSQGGVAIFYQVTSQGLAGRGSSASVIAEYRKVLGIAGGL